MPLLAILIFQKMPGPGIYAAIAIAEK